jgi:HAD superfamily hydrolase (TIGR01509 family)
MIAPGGALIFDMDGVLLDSGAWHRAAWDALLTELGESPPRPDYWRLTIGRPSEEAIPLLLGRRVSDWEAYQLARRKRDHYARLSRQGPRAVAGVADFVADLARRRVPLAVGTSASSYDVDHLLRGIGLLHHFPVVVTADDVTYGKPDPEVYTLAARRLRAEPAQCLVFEDSVVGIHAARAAACARSAWPPPIPRRSSTRRAPSASSITSRASDGTRSDARKHTRLLGGPLRRRPGRLGASRARAGPGRLVERGRKAWRERGRRAAAGRGAGLRAGA